MQSDGKKPGTLPLALILAGTALLYLPSLFYGFTYDDRYQILRNPRIESWKFLGSYFVHHIWFHQSPQGSYYRPVFLIWLRLNQQLFDYHPLGWHATTVLLHLVVAWLVYELLRKTIADSFVVIVGTAIFALHPAHLESVAWISGLTDPLFAIPLLGALLCWLEYREERQRSWLFWSLLLTLVALFAKETAMILPVLVFVYACALSNEPSRGGRLREGYREFAPFLCTFACFWFFRVLVIHSEQLELSRPIREILPNMPLLLRFYGAHLSGLAPIGIYYDLMPIHWQSGAALLGVATLTALALCGWWATKHSPEWLIALAWMALPILVASSAVTVFLSEHDSVHDRYLYLATIGFGIAIAKLLSQIRAGSAMVFGRPVGETVGGIVVLAALLFATINQMPQWHDDLALFKRGAETAPNNPVAHKQFAYQLHLRNREGEAKTEYEHVVSLDPSDSDANFALAVIAHDHDDWENARRYCQQARKAAPFEFIACYRFESVSLMHMGKLKDAEKLIEHAIAYWPHEPRQHVLLGEILEQEGRHDAARQQFLSELDLGESSEARTELAKLEH